MGICSFNSNFPWLTYIVLSKKLKDLIKGSSSQIGYLLKVNCPEETGTATLNLT